MKYLRCDKRHERSHKHHQGHRHVEEHHHAKNHHRRQAGDDELRQVLAKIDFELFDAVDHRQNSVAGALKAEMRRPKFRDLIEDHRAEMELDLRRCVMRDHGA